LLPTSFCLCGYHRFLFCVVVVTVLFLLQEMLMGGGFVSGLVWFIGVEIGFSSVLMLERAMCVEAAC